MNTRSRCLPFLLILGLMLGTAGSYHLIPDAAAAGSKDKRTIRKLKKQVRGFRKTVNGVKAQLATKNSQLADTQAQLAVEEAKPAFIEMVTVGNPGNAADPLNSSSVPGIGAVAEAFQIGKYEVTNAQYAVFLNAVAAADTYGLFNASMESDARGGIRQSGADGSYRYTAKSAMCDKPVNFVSFWDACRFCNWLHNGMPSGAQEASTTEDGAYTLTPVEVGANTVARNAGAKYFIPSEDQWYKAAYHDPRLEADRGPPGDDNYWLYPTRNDGQPTKGKVNTFGEITNDDGNIANYNRGADWNGQDGNLTTVGSGGAGSASFYGAFDMGGNLREWNETVIDGSFRGLLGGGWSDIERDLGSSWRNFFEPHIENEYRGFRVASP